MFALTIVCLAYTDELARRTYRGRLLHLLLISDCIQSDVSCNFI
jgi:hypothetical protein